MAFKPVFSPPFSMGNTIPPIINFRLYFTNEKDYNIEFNFKGLGVNHPNGKC